MEEKNEIKISLKKAIILSLILIILTVIIVLTIIFNYNKENENINNVSSSIAKSNERESTEYTEIEGSYRIIGTNSNLLYKNDYETGTCYSEKVIYLDEEKLQQNTTDVEDFLYYGTFDREFINVEYSKDAAWSTCLAYISDEGFRNCTTNEMIKKAFDKDGNEIEVPEFLTACTTGEGLEKEMIFYALFDISTSDNDSYIVGVYCKDFSDYNWLALTVVLKKENANIDITDEEQVEEFWNKYASYEIEEAEASSTGDYEAVEINGTIYYHRLTASTWNGEYTKDTYYTATSNNIQKVVSYSDYIKYIEEINDNATEGISSYYKDKKSNYIILSYANGNSWCGMEIIDCIEENNQIIIYGDEGINGVMASGSGYFIAIPTNMPIGTEVIYRECYSTSQISNLQNYGTVYSSSEMSVDKPIIYLYPTEDTEVSVILGNAESLTVSYPKYSDGWNVYASSDGTLIDIETNKELYSLYYESKANIDFEVTNEGFIVKGEEVAEFLEEKLAILGLTEREAEEFIIYWLPILQENEYNYIRFATAEEIEENMPLEINPNPDTIIRILMTYKGLDEPIEVEEQNLTTPERIGFVAVEWGGTEIK